MKPLVCSAPGKLFLGGEYAVMRGGRAVVTAVNRRAEASVTDEARRSSPLIREAREAVRRYLGVESVPHVFVKSRGFTNNRKKIGLGSSAAACASACGALFEHLGMHVSENREVILKVATEAHREAQGGKGSGADVAIAVTGGTIVYTMSGEKEAVELEAVEIAAVWTGKPASTKNMIDIVAAFERADPEGHRRIIENLSECADILAKAYREQDVRAIVAATSSYGEAMDELGRASKAPIVTPDLRRMASMAENLGGAAKPSGAGGGDAAVAVFENKESLEAFKAACREQGFQTLALKMGEPGLRREEAL